MTQWHDLYTHGERINFVCKSFDKKFRHAERDDNEAMMQIWGEALRKATMNCVDIAKTVLGVEEIIKGRAIHA